MLELPIADWGALDRRDRGGCAGANRSDIAGMKIPDEPGAVLIAAFVVLLFLFLFVLQRGALSQRQQTGIWIVFTFLFFAICSAFVHSGAPDGRNVDPQAVSNDR
jgi:hypothetical protein